MTAATRVSAASATPEQKVGQRDWVKGAGLLASGLNDSAQVYRDYLRGDSTSEKSAFRAFRAFRAFERKLKTGERLGTKGDQLLSLPAGD